MRSSLLFRRWRRVLLTLIPLALALLHVSAAMPLPLLERLDQFIYGARLRLGMSRTLDERIVIVDIDENRRVVKIFNKPHRSHRALALGPRQTRRSDPRIVRTPACVCGGL